jgi:hypothetical protein
MNIFLIQKIQKNKTSIHNLSNQQIDECIPYVEKNLRQTQENLMMNKYLLYIYKLNIL